MTIEFILPELGENVTGGDIVTIFVAEGDTIDLDQPVLELETDKAVIEVPSNVAGVVKQILVKAGDVAKPGQLILTIAAEGGSAVLPKPLVVEAPPESEPTPVETAPESEPVAQDLVFELPELGENVISGDIVSIFVRSGDDIALDQAVLEIETDKAVIEVPSSVVGEVKEVLVKEGDKISPGQPVLKVTGIAPSKRKSKQAPKPAPSPVPISAPAKITDSGPVAGPALASPAAPSTKRPPESVPAAPSVRRLAREIGIDITEVAGTGPGGRILLQDVKAFSRQKHVEARTAVEQPPVAAPDLPAAKPLPDFSKWGDIETESMSNVRRATAEHLSYAWGAPHVTQFDKADITEAEAFRKRFAKQAEAAGGKLTVTAILLKVVAAALKKFPQFNASIDMAKREVIYKKYVHIGVAVDTPRGLLVPVIRDVDQKSMVQLAAELAQMSDRARNRKTGLDELQGGTFSISNLGGIGGTAFTPVVNAPEVAILGVSRGGFEPVYNRETGQFEPRMMLPLALSYDHRLIDGADGARFIRWIVEAIENPFLMSLE